MVQMGVYREWTCKTPWIEIECTRGIVECSNIAKSPHLQWQGVTERPIDSVQGSEQSVS